MSNPIFQAADLLLPAAGTDLQKWAVIACDQFTSQPEYWQKAEDLVGEAPSTLRLILPELYLEQPGVDGRIKQIHATMGNYLAGVLSQKRRGYVYLERQMLSGAKRQGLVGCVDLEAYSYEKDAAPMIRPTEKTVLERIPPRLAIRRGAPLESPHILMLVDDEDESIVEMAGERAKAKAPIYDIDLMLEGGKLQGWLLDSEGEIAAIDKAIEAFSATALGKTRYGGANDKPFVMAMGDGNHSLASAKALWEEIKKGLSQAEQATHPARYCMVELENIQSDAIEIEPIHRVVFGVDAPALQKALADFAAKEGVALAKDDSGEQRFTLVKGGDKMPYSAKGSPYPLTAGLVQAFLNWYEEQNPAAKVDYVHGEQAVADLSSGEAVGILLPALEKADLFKGVALGGVLPKKTFSMGHATEKRYYLECRKIL